MTLHSAWLLPTIARLVADGIHSNRALHCDDFTQRHSAPSETIRVLLIMHTRNTTPPLPSSLAYIPPSNTIHDLLRTNARGHERIVEAERSNTLLRTAAPYMLFPGLRFAHTQCIQTVHIDRSLFRDTSRFLASGVAVISLHSQPGSEFVRYLTRFTNFICHGRTRAYRERWHSSLAAHNIPCKCER